MKNLVKYQLPPLAWIVLIFVLSSLPKLHVTFETPLGADKIVHALMFFVLCLLVRRAFFHQGYFPLMSRYALLGAFIFTAVYGILDEYHQQFAPNRVPDFYDFLADVGGAVLYVGIYWVTRKPNEDGESSQAG